MTPKDTFLEKPPSQNPCQGTPDLANSLCLGPLFLSKIQEKGLHKEFRRGGVLRAPKFFMLNFFASRVLCFAPENCQFRAFHPPRPPFCGEVWRSILEFSSDIEVFTRSRESGCCQGRPRHNHNHNFQRKWVFVLCTRPAWYHVDPKFIPFCCTAFYPLAQRYYLRKITLK